MESGAKWMNCVVTAIPVCLVWVVVEILGRVAREACGVGAEAAMCD